MQPTSWCCLFDEYVGPLVSTVCLLFHPNMDQDYIWQLLIYFACVIFVHIELGAFLAFVVVILDPKLILVFGSKLTVGTFLAFIADFLTDFQPPLLIIVGKKIVKIFAAAGW